MQLNAEDGGNRKFIMVQLPEETDPKSEAYKAGYKNICEIGKERIRRAGKKIEEELNAKLKEGELFKDKEPKTPDTGFRVLKVDSTNMKDVYYSPQYTSDASGPESNIRMTAPILTCCVEYCSTGVCRSHCPTSPKRLVGRMCTL